MAYSGSCVGAGSPSATSSSRASRPTRSRCTGPGFPVVATRNAWRIRCGSCSGTTTSAWHLVTGANSGACAISWYAFRYWNIGGFFPVMATTGEQAS